MPHEDRYTDRLTLLKQDELQVHFYVISLSYVQYTRLKVIMIIYASVFQTIHPLNCTIQLNGRIQWNHLLALALILLTRPRFTTIVRY